MYKIVLILLIATFVYSYDDSDLDGVEDIYDKCPQTPFTDLVDQRGCSIKSIDDTIYFDIITGIGYSKVNYSARQRADTFSISFQGNIYIQDWGIEFFTSKYYSKIEDNTKSGFDDTVLDIFYKYAWNERLAVSTGAGIVLPTYETGYDNEKTDYFIFADFEYYTDYSIYTFGGLGYTWIRDSNTNLFKYQDTSNFYLGAGYMLDSKNSFSFSYNQKSSIYKGIDDIKILRAGYSYQVDPHWFVRGDYDYGLNDYSSNYALLLRIGYGF